MSGAIHITPYFDELIDELTHNLKPQYYRIFSREELKIDDAKEIIAESYLCYEEETLIILTAHKYNIAAQNALLKIIEEPPRNICFIIIAKNKNALLPTIRSRMPIHMHKHKAEIAPFALDVQRLSLEAIYTFCKDNDNAHHTKEEIKQQIQSLLFAIHKARIPLTKKELGLFDKAIAYNQNDATERHNYIFLPLLLRIYQKQKTKHNA